MTALEKRFGPVGGGGVKLGDITPSERGFRFEDILTDAVMALNSVTDGAIEVLGELQLRAELGASCNGVDLYIRHLPTEGETVTIAAQAKWETKTGGQQAFSQFLVAADRVDAHFASRSARVWVARLPLTAHAHEVAGERGVYEIWGGPYESFTAFAFAAHVASVFRLQLPVAGVFAACRSELTCSEQAADVSELRAAAAAAAEARALEAAKVVRARRALIEVAIGNFQQLFDLCLFDLGRASVGSGFLLRDFFSPPGAQRDSWPVAVLDLDRPCAVLRKTFQPKRGYPVDINDFRRAVAVLRRICDASYLFDNYARSRARLETAEARRPDVGAGRHCYLPTIKRDSPQSNLQAFYNEFAPKCTGYGPAHQRWPDPH